MQPKPTLLLSKPSHSQKQSLLFFTKANTIIFLSLCQDLGGIINL